MDHSMNPETIKILRAGAGVRCACHRCNTDNALSSYNVMISKSLMFNYRYLMFAGRHVDHRSMTCETITYVLRLQR